MLAVSDDIDDRWFPWLREREAKLSNANVECSSCTPLGVLTHIGNVEAVRCDVVEGEQPALGDGEPRDPGPPT